MKIYGAIKLYLDYSETGICEGLQYIIRQMFSV